MLIITPLIAMEILCGLHGPLVDKKETIAVPILPILLLELLWEEVWLSFSVVLYALVELSYVEGEEENSLSCFLSEWFLFR